MSKFGSMILTLMVSCVSPMMGGLAPAELERLCRDGKVESDSAIGLMVREAAGSPYFVLELAREPTGPAAVSGKQDVNSSRLQQLIAQRAAERFQEFFLVIDEQDAHPRGIRRNSFFLAGSLLRLDNRPGQEKLDGRPFSDRASNRDGAAGLLEQPVQHGGIQIAVALADQQLAAGVLWVPGSIALTVAICINFYLWLDPEAGRRPRRLAGQH